jgi:hypothetical protein
VTTRAVVGIVAFCVAMTGVIIANILLVMMIGEINRTRQEGNLVSYFGFTFPKILRIFAEYRRSYPRGKIHVYALMAFALGVIAMLAVAVCIRIIPI